MRLEAMLLSQSILHNGIQDAYGISLRQHRAPCLNRFGIGFLHPILTSRHTQSANILEKQPTEEISAWMSLQCTSEQLRLVHSRRSRTHRGSDKSRFAAARESDFTPVPNDKDILNSDTSVDTELDMLTDEPITFVDATDTNNEWYETQLVDRCKLIAIGGRGGNGCVSFRREKHVPLGGADGGNGGPGGSVYLICDDEISNLKHVKKLYIYKAESGNHGLGGRRNGAKGKHCYIPVPPGTHVYNKEGKLYAILQRKGDTLMLVRGGRGGKGNRYYKTKFNPTPHVCELGEEGFKRELLLNYKMLGNLALIGKPNSGKSSLLRCLSNARPRVSNQAFSTKFPILGVFKINDQADVDPDNDTTQDSHRTTGEINTELDDICRNANNAFTSTYTTALTGGNYIQSEQDESGIERPSIKSHTPNAFSHTSMVSEVTDGYKDTDDDVFDDNINPEHNGDDQYSPRLPLKSLEDQAAYNKDSSKSYSHLYGFLCRNKYAIQNDNPPLSSKNGSYILDGKTNSGTLSGDKSLSTDLCVDELSTITDELSSGLNTSMSDCTTESGDTQDNSYSEDDSDAYLEEDSFHTAAAMEELCDITPDVPTSQVRKQLVIADVPGLIQGASSGKGLGHKFLKHIENSNVLTYVIDSSVTDPLQDYIDVKNEIFTYNPDLLNRLELIILNKIDLIDRAKVEQLVKEFTEEVNHTRIYPVSAKTRANMYMLERSFKWIYRLPMTKKEIDGKPISLAIDDPDDFRKLNPRKFKVEKIAEGKFRIISDYLQRKIPMMRFDIRESLDRLRRILRINRIHLKLKKMGVEQGDTLQIGDTSFCVNELAC